MSLVREELVQLLLPFLAAAVLNCSLHNLLHACHLQKLSDAIPNSFRDFLLIHISILMNEFEWLVLPKVCV